MSATIKGAATVGLACDVLTRLGQVGVIIEGDYRGHILVRTFSGYVSLTAPQHTWSSECRQQVEVKPAGTTVTYISEV